MLRTFSLFAAIYFLLISVTIASDPCPDEIDLFPTCKEDKKEGTNQVTWKRFHEDKSDGSKVWDIRDGTVLCRGTPKGYLYTEQKFTNFRLTLEWRWPKGAKPGRGGVLFRTTGDNKIWPKSLEAQINAPDAGDFWGLDGFDFDGPADRKMILEETPYGRLTNLKKTENAELPPGQWNQYEILAKSDTVTLKINGKQVNRATGCDVTPGRICLTAEGDPIEYRNVKLIPLDK